MNTYEVITALSKNKLNSQECYEIEEYFKTNPTWDLLIGQLLFHRLSCRAYKHLMTQNWIIYLPPTLKRNLWNSFAFHTHKNALSRINFEKLILELNENNIRYCIIKGLALENDLFLDNVREYNDTDLLVHSRDYESTNDILINLGYKCGEYNPKTNTIKTDRNKEIFHIINTHQTLTYCKILDDPFFKVEGIDLQFELTLQKKHDYNIDIDYVLNNRISISINGISFYTLDAFNNFLMLCTHLYGEAILIQEIKNYKDLQIMKFADIYEWIEKYYEQFDWDDKIEYIKSNGFLKPVLYCTYIISNLYTSSKSEGIVKKIGKQNLDFLDEYRDESFNVKKWKISVMDRIFRTDKLNML